MSRVVRCSDLLLRGARYDDADERTTLCLFLALRDREHLLACPGDARAVVTWGRRLLTFPGAGGLGHDGPHDMLELELLNRADAQDRAGLPGSRTASRLPSGRGGLGWTRESRGSA